MSRKTARRSAFSLCFQMSFHDISELEKTLDFFFTENTVDEDDEKYINEVVRGVFKNAAEIDALIEEHSKKWETERISKVDMAIMRICVFEIVKMDGIPGSVSVNEAVELAKMYGTEESPMFVNGVLGGILRYVEQ